MIVFDELIIHGNFNNTKYDYKNENMPTYVTLDGKNYNCQIGNWSIWIPELEIKIPWSCNGGVTRILDRKRRLRNFSNRNEDGFNLFTKKRIGNEYALFKFLSKYNYTPPVGDTTYIKTVINEYTHEFTKYDSTGVYGFKIRDANDLSRGMWNISIEEFIDKFSSDIHWSRFSIQDIFKEKNIINGYLIDLHSRYPIKLKHIDSLSIFEKYFNYIENADELKKKIASLTQFPYNRRRINYQSYILDNEYQKGSRDTLYRFDIMQIPDDLNGKKILDLGCNLGAVCIESYRRGALGVLGVDNEKDYIECARDLARYNGFHIDYANFDLKNVDNVVDYVKKYFYKTTIDVVFALALYKHIGESIFKILDKLSWKVCYIESHSAKKGLETKHVKEMISHMNNMKDVTVEYLGMTSDRSNRLIWKIIKEDG